jgi:triacylglycerol lipase
VNRDVDVLGRLDFTSIWTPWDLSILPPQSSVLPVGRSIQVPVVLHPWMVWSRRSIDEVVRLLEGED